MANAKLKRSISRIAYAMIESTDPETGVDTYGEVKMLPHIAGGREYSIEPVGDNMAVFADGLEVYSEDNNMGYDITLTTVAVTDAIEKDWYGKQIDSDGVTEFSNSAEYPYFALFIYEETTDGIGEISFFGKCHIKSRRSESGKTKEEGSIDPNFPEHSIACRPRFNDNFVMKKIKGNQKLTAVPVITKDDGVKATSYLADEE